MNCWSFCQCRCKPKWGPSPKLPQLALNSLVTFYLVITNHHTVSVVFYSCTRAVFILHGPFMLPFLVWPFPYANLYGLSLPIKAILGPPLHCDRALFPRALPWSGGSWGWSAPALHFVCLCNFCCRLQGQPYRACFDYGVVSRFYCYIVLRFPIPSALADVCSPCRRHSQLNSDRVYWSWGYLWYCLHHRVC